ncbi:hypothetical protein [Bradyrhizobium sp. DASA03120]|uniref:hypothetical protein n=1 Tax=Bradyrhizobium sp. SMVTL-02 TaxID=3395917 RepID=UPI003F6FCE3B
MEIDQSRFRQLVQDSREDRDRVRKLVEDKRWCDDEPDRIRMAMYTARTARQTMPKCAEAVQGPDDMQVSWLLPAGATARRAVAFVESSNGGKWTACTGFLISPDLFITHQHVVADENAALATQITFDREMGKDGSLNQLSSTSLNGGSTLPRSSVSISVSRSERPTRSRSAISRSPAKRASPSPSRSFVKEPVT